MFWALLLDAFTASAWENWGQIIGTIQRIQALTDQVACFDNLTGRLGAAAPVWTSRIVDSHGDEAAAGLVACALRAWEWRRTDIWLSEITGADDPATLQRQLEGKLREAARATAELASESAWLCLSERLTDAERHGAPADRQGHQAPGTPAHAA